MAPDFSYLKRLPIESYGKMISRGYEMTEEMFTDALNVIAAAVDGRQPASMTRSSLWEATSIPLDWESQRRLLGFA